jgi:hypothetical protein
LSSSVWLRFDEFARSPRNRVSQAASLSNTRSKCPIGRAFDAFGEIPAPDGSLDGIDRPPNDVEGPGGIEFANHGRLREMMVGVHDHLETARRLDPCRKRQRGSGRSALQAHGSTWHALAEEQDWLDGDAVTHKVQDGKLLPKRGL